MQLQKLQVFYLDRSDLPLDPTPTKADKAGNLVTHSTTTPYTMVPISTDSLVV